MSLEFMAYDDARSTPNVVVDGAPNEATVLTLTHWPGVGQPSGMAADLSAQMAFKYLDAPPPHAPARVVTNNHFDQDGLVSAFALVEPEVAMAHRELLIDLAAAGDFGTYADRRAARASMTISRLAEREFDDYAAFCAERYTEALPLVMPMLLDAERFRDRWGDEDDELTRSEKALADGTVQLAERTEVDLAVFTAAEHWAPSRGHRFGGRVFEGVHPMALNNATTCARVLLVHGRRYRYVDRYETWVQMQSRRPPARTDLRPLAADLTSREPGAVTWNTDGPDNIMPTLHHSGESSLAPETLTEVVVRHLRDAPAAWDPYRLDR